MNNKNTNQINPEIQREQTEKQRAERIYDEDDAYGSLSLYPGVFLGGAASATESTGLIQVIPPTHDMLDIYDEVYRYRQPEPVADKEDE